MGALTFLSYEAACPSCGGRHGLRVQTGIARWDDLGAHDLRVGDRFVLATEALARAYQPAAAVGGDGAIHVLEDGLRCGNQDLWTEVTVADGALISLGLVPCDLATLARVNYLCGGHCGLWDWARGLADPSDWNDDLASDDRVENLRLKLMLREVLPARNWREVDLFVAAMGLEVAGSPAADEGDGRRVWQLTAKRGDGFEAPPITLRFTLADDARHDGVVRSEGASAIVPAERFRHSADELAARVPAYTADLAGAADDLLTRARHDLGQAIADLEQVAAMMPAGDDRVPARAFWGDGGRAVLAARADRFGRAMITATLTRWRDDLARLGVRPVPVVRSAEEAHLYMLVCPCPRCAAATPALPSRIEAHGTRLVSIYSGPCPQCALPRRFELQLDERIPEGDGVSLGAGTSTALDPGQFLLAVDRLVRGISAERVRIDPPSKYALELAVAALEQVLAVIPAGADAVPPATITSRPGWAAYDAEPGRFARARLQAVRATYRELLGHPRLRLVE